MVPALLGCGACSAPEQRFEFRQLHMGCEARIVLHAATRERAVRAARAAFDRIAALDSTLSDWRNDNEIARLALAVEGEAPLPVELEVSPDLADALRCALGMVERTEGRFDPTLGALTRLWRRARAGEPPSDAEIAAARAASGSDGIRLSGRRVGIERRGLRLDFGAIGKGFAADQALEVLTELGHPRSLVQIGGDGAVGEAPPGRRGWRVTLASTGETTELDPWSGMATSGDSEQWILLEGERRSHVLDPHRGLGVSGSAMVTVIVAGDRGVTPGARCGPGAVADALATAITLADEEGIRRMLERTPGAAAVVVHPGEPRRISRFGAALRESPPDPAAAP